MEDFIKLTTKQANITIVQNFKERQYLITINFLFKLMGGAYEKFAKYISRVRRIAYAIYRAIFYLLYVLKQVENKTITVENYLKK